MTKAVQNRSNTYYRDRLEREHPAIFADFQRGKFKNLSQALKAAGLRKNPTPLEQLTAAWAQATQAERDSFKAQIGCIAAGNAPVLAPAPPTAATPTGSISPAIHQGGRLSPAAAQQIRRIMANRRLQMGQVMAELGYGRHDMSLAGALHRAYQIKNEGMLDALAAWIKQHGS